ncbi:5-formyltetrahydrofolate cyclo-ligase [Caldifermentibacillus hisashii]|uniref:5-formyltetrahydrofolate cyclo-ligase n=1 Tax=Caldifermentibacillus hisashii TaxID=996558 RepID=A0ABU9JYE1_9BACI
MISKKEFREKMKAKLLLLTKEDYHEKSSLIAEKLFKTEEWNKAKMIGITISRFPEVSTYPIIERAWSEEKLVAVPKCIPSSRALQFYTIHNFSEVEKGYFGLYEPLPKKAEKTDPAKIDLLFVPGLAFTKNGFRLGYGGGYYDRFLPNFTGESIVLSFQEQLVDWLPFEEYDYQLKKILTDDNMYGFEK